MNFPNRKGWLLLCIFLYSFWLASCDSRRVYEQTAPIPQGVWHRGNKVSFEADIQDTLSFHNFYISIRNRGDYGYMNLYVFLDIRSPGGNTVRDTLECILAEPSGRWFGSGIGDIFDNRILFSRNIRFPIRGKYTFVFEQAMREDALDGIMDVGLRIEKGG